MRLATSSRIASRTGILLACVSCLVISPGEIYVFTAADSMEVFVSGPLCRDDAVIIIFRQGVLKEIGEYTVAVSVEGML